MVDNSLKVAGFNPPQTDEEKRIRRLMAFRIIPDDPIDPDIDLLDGGDARGIFDDTLVGGAAGTSFTYTIGGGTASSVA